MYIENGNYIYNLDNIFCFHTVYWLKNIYFQNKIKLYPPTKNLKHKKTVLMSCFLNMNTYDYLTLTKTSL